MARRRHLIRGIVFIALGCAALGGVVAFGIGASSYLSDRPYVWYSTGVTLAYDGRIYEHRVLSHENLLLVLLPRPSWDETLVVDPAKGAVHLVNPPERLFGQTRTRTLYGVQLTGGGKSDTRADVKREGDQIRVRLTPSLIGGKPGTFDEFELRLGPGAARGSAQRKR